MDTKLTLKIDNQVITNAKIYARKKNTSLSKLIESYLFYITTVKKSADDEVTPLVKSLSGIITISKSTDLKESYKKHLIKKYVK